MAFNPETGSIHKVWRGEMDFRGKVWDFSQDNSRANGRIYHASPSELWRLPDGGKLPDGWAAQGVTPVEGGWLFNDAGATLTSPPIDASGWRRVFLAFDETSRKGPFRLNVFDTRSSATAQWFDSATSADSDAAWQWNFKRIERPGPETSVTVTTPVAGKRLRGLRLYGDRPTWLDGDGHPLEVLWDGYDLVNQTEAVNIRYRLRFAGGETVAVRFRPELTPQGWRESWSIKDLPKGRGIYMRREGLSKAVKVRTDLLEKDGQWIFTDNGDHAISFDLPAGER
ncbi:MAG: hypothetical protein EOO25_06580 [Comamonadaceae bacterium]|nr:MAG: hypothetical protein EOO25_06580 [Comamonadaceae bacterium]